MCKIPYVCILHEQKHDIDVDIEMHQFIIKDYVPLSNSLETPFFTVQTKEADIVAGYKKIAKLERHFSDEQILILNGDDVNKIKDRILTIAFLDIDKFSELSEILKGNENLLVEFLQEYYRTSTEIIFKFNGLLDKFSGDCTMAIFGVLSKDRTGTEGAICSVAAVVELMKFFKELVMKWTKIWKKYVPHKTNISLRCGINTGKVTFGNIGTVKTDQLTAIGTNVNIASRLESRAKPGKILISATTKERVESHYRLRPVGTLYNLKNIVGEFESFEVEWEK